MTLPVSPLHPRFGAHVAADRVDDPGLAPAVADAVGRYGLVLLRGLLVEDDALERFAGRFGKLQNLSGEPGVERHVIRVSNLGDDGRVKPADDTTRLRHEANLLWHTDSSFLSPGASYSFLNARIVTSEGGETQFCDTRVAWEALPADRRRRLGPLHADHSMAHSWRLVGVDLAAVAARPMPAVRRRLAPVHRPTGRTALMIPSHVARIEGMDEADGRTLLAELTAAATAPERIYTHKWLPGDLLIWDNRCMLHRVTPYDGFAAPRDLRSCRVVDADDDSTIAAA